MSLVNIYKFMVLRKQKQGKNQNSQIFEEFFFTEICKFLVKILQKRVLCTKEDILQKRVLCTEEDILQKQVLYTEEDM